MRTRWRKAILTGIAAGLLCATAASAQTDIAVSGFRTFNTGTTGNGATQSTSDSYGGMVELRHIQAPFLGYEATYSLNPANQSIAVVPGSCGYYCSVRPVSLTSKTHEISLDWLASRQMGNLRPFAVAGLGFAIAVPGKYPQYYLNTVVRPAYFYGAGADWGFGSRAGVRLQYRGSLFKEPMSTRPFPPPGDTRRSANR